MTPSLQIIKNSPSVVKLSQTHFQAGKPSILEGREYRRALTELIDPRRRRRKRGQTSINLLGRHEPEICKLATVQTRPNDDARTWARLPELVVGEEEGGAYLITFLKRIFLESHATVC